MAVETSYLTDNSNREDLADKVGILFPKDAQIYNAVSHTKALARTTEWTLANLASAGVNASQEGAAFSEDTLVEPTRDSNVTQINKGQILVSRTAEQVSTAGLSSIYQYQKEKRMQEVIRDVEYSMIQGTVSAGSSAAPGRKMDGILAYITTTVITGTGTGTEAFSRTMLDDALQSIFGNFGDPDVLFVNAFQARQAAAFTNAAGDYRRNIDASEKTLVNEITTYDGPVSGAISVRVHRLMPTDQALIVDTKLLEIAELQPMYHEMLPKDGDRVRGHIVWEGTIKVYQEAGLGKVTGLTTS